MTTITREVRINANKEKVWQILADFGNIYLFNPSVPKSYSTSEANGGVGATRHCDLAPFGSIEERILEWYEGDGYLLEIYEGDKAPPFKKAIAKFELKADRDQTIVTGTIEYTLKGGPVGALMNVAMVKSNLSKAWAKLLAGLKHYAETGEPVEAGVPVNLTAVVAVA